MMKAQVKPRDKTVKFILILIQQLNPYVPNAPFLYLLKTPINNWKKLVRIDFSEKFDLPQNRVF